jgi:putative iron-only hydrogenase system regulator
MTGAVFLAEYRIAFIGAILEDPENSQREFNSVVSSFKPIIRNRSGTPFPEGVAVISLVVSGDVDKINALTGRLGQIPNVQVRSAISKRSI